MYKSHGKLTIIRCDLCNRKRFGKQLTHHGEVVLELCPSCQKPGKHNK